MGSGGNGLLCAMLSAEAPRLFGRVLRPRRCIEFSQLLGVGEPHAHAPGLWRGSPSPRPGLWRGSRAHAPDFGVGPEPPPRLVALGPRPSARPRVGPPS